MVEIVEKNFNSNGCNIKNGNEKKIVRKGGVLVEKKLNGPMKISKIEFRKSFRYKNSEKKKQ